MKKSILIVSILSLMVLNNCGGIKGLMTFTTDPKLVNVGKVNVLPSIDSVGFEWAKITDKNIQGINIYRGDPLQSVNSFQRIGTIGNRYATHFVDTHVEADNTYSYIFTTFYMGRESLPSERIDTRTLASFASVPFLESYKVSSNAIKLLWKPHSNASVNSYIIHRSVDNQRWSFVSRIDGRLMVEYIDTFVGAGHSYKYRIVAQSYNKILSTPSESTQLIQI